MNRIPVAVAILLVFSALLFLPGIASVPPLDRDEPRFTQATKQMLETGDLVDIRFQDEARHKKPVGIYWLQAAVVELIGGDRTAVWKYRIVSLAGATAAVLLTFWMAKAFLTSTYALVAALLLASTILLGVEAHIAKTDAVLLACIVGAQGVVARIRPDGGRLGWRLVLLFWCLIGTGVLIKGPIILMVVGLTLLALCLWQRRAAWLLQLRPLAGLLISAAIAAPWLIAISLRTDGAFFDEALGRDLIGKIATGQESHGAPPGAHLAVMVATFWPATAVLGVGAVGFRALLDRPAVRFALCWAVPTWLVFELTATKLPHYVLPVFPALTLLAAALAADASDRPGPPWLRGVMAALLVIVPLAVLVGSVAVPLVIGDSVVWAAVPVAAAAVLAALGAARALLARRVPAATGWAAVTAVLIGLTSYGLVLPRLPALWISSRIVAGAEAGSSCPHPRIVSVGWREPSLVFLAGTDTAFKSVASAIEELAGSGCSVLAIEERFREEFLALAGNDGIEVGAVGAVDGVALNGGDAVSIVLYQRTAE